MKMKLTNVKLLDEKSSEFKFRSIKGTSFLSILIFGEKNQTHAHSCHVTQFVEFYNLHNFENLASVTVLVTNKTQKLILQ